MIYDTHDYLIFRLRQTSYILTGTKEHNMLETGFVSVFRWREEDTYSLGRLERAKMSHWVSDCGSFFLRNPAE
jgi:hypothetical protein